MTISEMGGSIRKNTVMRSDGGGNGMNLINRMLMKLGNSDRKSQNAKEAENIIYDYGYILYKSLEYGIKHKKNDNVEFEKNLLNTIKY